MPCRPPGARRRTLSSPGPGRLRRPHDPTTLGGGRVAVDPRPCGGPMAVPNRLEGPMSNPYVPILVLMSIAGVLALGGVGASAILGPKRYNRAKLAAYECGIDPTPPAAGGGRGGGDTALVGLELGPVVALGAEDGARTDTAEGQHTGDGHQHQDRHVRVAHRALQPVRDSHRAAIRARIDGDAATAECRRVMRPAQSASGRRSGGPTPDLRVARTRRRAASSPASSRPVGVDRTGCRGASPQAARSASRTPARGCSSRRDPPPSRRGTSPARSPAPTPSTGPGTGPRPPPHAGRPAWHTRCPRR